MAARHLVGGTFLAVLRHLLALLAARCVRCAAHNAPSVKTNVLGGHSSGARYARRTVPVLARYARSQRHAGTGC